MASDGSLRSTQAWENRRESVIDPADPSTKSLDMVNHSSLVAGGAVGAAGELQVNQGKLEMLTDQSGHFKPDNNMTFQALMGMHGMGVDLLDTTVKMTPKVAGFGPAMLRGNDPDGKYAYASAAEFMSHDGAMDAESQIRTSRKGRSAEIAQAHADREARNAGAFADPRAERDSAYLEFMKAHPFHGQY